MAGGQLPRWRANGRQRRYRAPGGAIMVVQAPGATAVLSLARVAVADPHVGRTVHGFDVAPDGQRFVAFGRGHSPVLTLVADWAARLVSP